MSDTDRAENLEKAKKLALHWDRAEYLEKCKNLALHCLAVHNNPKMAVNTFLTSLSIHPETAIKDDSVLGELAKIAEGDDPVFTAEFIRGLA